jgi:hypothetical protein
VTKRSRWLGTPAATNPPAMLLVSGSEFRDAMVVAELAGGENAQVDGLSRGVGSFAEVCGPMNWFRFYC